ncbi:MAG: exo-beta-N-acetylmuramidase NamZ family protein [Longimicrobiaceae bacterium]
MSVVPGLEVLLGEKTGEFAGARAGLCCNHTAVDRRLRHAAELLPEAGFDLVRLFGPEHGTRAAVQMMEGVDEQPDAVTGLPTVSLYGDSEESLHPAPETLEDLDTVFFDIQDIGARYYTYQATLGYLMEVAGRTGTRVVVLDRPNPLGGTATEGPLVHPGYQSFVGAFPLAVRHGMTAGELALYFTRHCGVECEVEVIPCRGWRRDSWFDQTGLPWVYPSPNIPTLETAAVYPGMCLFEATNVSEGRGTTRPFHLAGAPWLDPRGLAGRCAEGARGAGLEGVAFRPASFIPTFEKHAGHLCGGVEVHVLERDKLTPFLLGMVVLEAVYQTDPENFGWRTEPYEFVSDPPAIDLLTGSSLFRQTLLDGRPVHELPAEWKRELEAFRERRRECLLYRQ